MNLRHAASLALVGWYLLMPPWTGDPPTDVNTSAPLIKWNVEYSFDTRAECQQAKVDTSHLSDESLGDTVDAEAESSSGQMPTFEQRERLMKLLRKRMNESRCVSGDDSRLKAK